MHCFHKKSLKNTVFKQNGVKFKFVDVKFRLGNNWMPYLCNNKNEESKAGTI